MAGTATWVKQDLHARDIRKQSGVHAQDGFPPFALESEVGWQEDQGFPITSMS